MARLAVTVAGVGLDFVGSTPAVAAFLRRRFAGFAGTRRRCGGPIEIELDLRGRRPRLRQGGSAVALAELPGGGLRLESEAAHAEISPDNRHACLVGALAAQPVDALVRLVLARALLDRDALLVHAAALVMPAGEGVAFVGPSGSGKSTIASRLRGEVLGDEAVAVSRTGREHGTPYWRGQAARAPLAALLFVGRGRKRRWQPLPAARAAARLGAASGPLPAASWSRALELAAAIVARAPRVAAVTLARKCDIQDWLEPRLHEEGR
jgi:hypothetical protein